MVSVSARRVSAMRVRVGAPALPAGRVPVVPVSAGRPGRPRGAGLRGPAPQPPDHGQEAADADDDLGLESQRPPPDQQRVGRPRHVLRLLAERLEGPDEDEGGRERPAHHVRDPLGQLPLLLFPLEEELLLVQEPGEDHDGQQREEADHGGVGGDPRLVVGQLVLGVEAQQVVVLLVPLGQLLPVVVPGADDPGGEPTRHHPHQGISRAGRILPSVGPPRRRPGLVRLLCEGLGEDEGTLSSLAQCGGRLLGCLLSCLFFLFALISIAVSLFSF